MKKISKLAIVLLMALTAVFAITACNSVESISIDSSNMPQTVFVLGQDLDLSAGKLTVTDSKGSEEVALDSADVTVTGYDKNTLGSQDLTVTYKGKTTTLTVNVVSRMTVNGYTVKYFVGEDFDKTKGTITITRDDGSSFTVDMSDDAVTIEEFNNSAANSAASVTVRYKSGSEDYTGTFTVNVYAASEVTLKTPTKLSYYSHEEGIDLAGGYLELKSGSDYTKYVALTEDMISGFDLSAATADNRTNALEQTVFVTYDDVTMKSFTIQILYSDVSYIRQRAAELSSLDWTSAVPALTTEQKTNAYEAYELYSDLSDEEAGLISDEELLSIARVAVAAGYADWTAESGSYSDLFTVTEAGAVSLVCETYEATKRAYTSMNGSSFLELVNVLSRISTTLGSETLYGDVTIADYLATVPSSETLNTVLNLAGFMLNMYEAVAVVPANWKAGEIPTTEEVAALADYEYGITSAVTLINTYGYTTDVSSSYRSLYAQIASWREDYFDILYWYYYSQNNTDAIKLLYYVYLPGEVEELYELYVSTANLYYYTYYGYLTDSTNFMYYYQLVLEKAASLASSENALYRVLYNYFGFTYMIQSNLTLSYYSLLDAGLGDKAVMELWTKYLEIYNNCVTKESYFGGAEFNTAVQAMFNDFVALTPAQQYEFFCSLHYYYGSAPTYALYYLGDDGAYSYFTYFLVNYYHYEMPSEAGYLFQTLLFAMECYSRHSVISSQLTSFATYMERAIDIYDGLTDAVKESVDALIGDCYSKYLGIYQRYQASLEGGDEEGSTEEGEEETEEDLFAEYGEMADTFTELQVAIGNVMSLYMYAYYGYCPYSWVIAGYERAEALAALILDSEYADVYLYDDLLAMTYTDSNGDTVVIYWTFDYAMYYIRGLQNALLTGSYNSYGYSYYDFYQLANEDGTMEAFMADYFVLTLYVQFEYGEFGVEELQALMAKYRALSAYGQMMFIRQLDAYSSTVAYYYSELNTLLKSVMNENAYSVASNLLAAEQYYTLYRYYASLGDSYASEAATYLSYFKRQMQTVTAAYEALSNVLAEDAEEGAVSDKSSFDTYMQEVYEYYEEIYSEMIAEGEVEGDAEEAA